MIDFVPVDERPDERGRVFYEVRSGDRVLGYMLLPPWATQAFDAALSLAMTLHAALHPEEPLR